MNFTFSNAGMQSAAATHFVTTAALQAQVGKFQQNVPNGTISQVVSSSEEGGVQYVRTLDPGSVAGASQVITLPVAMPGAKPGDPQQMMQIQVLGPSLPQGVQQPKYMQIPIQGFQQGGVGAVLTVAYNPDSMEGLQLLNPVPEGVQLVATLQQDLQLVQQNDKDQPAILIPNSQQVLVQQTQEKVLVNNNNNHLKIKVECDNENDEDENSGLEGESNSGSGTAWQLNNNQDITSYLNKMHTPQVLPVSLQQYLKLNPECVLKREAVKLETAAEEPQHCIIIDTEDTSSKPKKKKKYKKRPLKPPRPKPGQVQIAQAVDGTPIFCCPECHMAYPEKEQLELHLSVHKIERRFICGICGAGLKRKEHLERHKLGHNPERPFVCPVCTKGFKRKEHLNLHAVIHSGEKTEICQECGKGFYRKDHLRKHARSHQSRRAREEGAGGDVALAPARHTHTIEVKPLGDRHMMPEITIHVPTSSNMQVPVQISVPHHIISTLPNGQQQITIGGGGDPPVSTAAPTTHQIDVEELFQS